MTGEAVKDELQTTFHWHDWADTRTTLSELVNEKRGISPEMAVRLSKVFGGSAETWLSQQARYDLSQVRTDRIKLKRLECAKACSHPMANEAAEKPTLQDIPSYTGQL
jgi:plasmid maintenance system antidote protein VapI